jgi:HEAT repeat protein
MPSSTSQKLEDALKDERAIAQQEERTTGRQKQNAYKTSKRMMEDKRALEKGQMTREEFVQRCYEDLKEDNLADLRIAAIELNKLNDVNGVEPLILFLKNNLYRESFNIALVEIGGITGRKDLRETNVISERIEIVKDIEDWWGRNKERGKAERIADLIVSGRNDKVRMEALNKLQFEMDKSAVPYLVKLLNEENKSTGMYETALRLLSKAGDKSAVPAVKSKLYHPDIYVRREAAITLNALGDKSAVQIMIATLSSKSRNSRSVANAVLKEITGQDFTGGKSLRRLSAEDEKTATNKWMVWWKENRSNMGADRVEDFSKVLAGEEAAMQLRYISAEEQEKNNPELPVFEDQAKTPKATFEQFRMALLKDDVKTALSLMSYPVREKYEKIFEQLGEHRRDYAKGLGRIYFDSKLGNILNYEMITEQDDGFFAFPVNFSQDDEGKWWIAEF